jgi:hypothetical protein
VESLLAADYARTGREAAWEPGKVMCRLRRKIAENGPEALGDEPAVVADLAANRMNRG